MSTLGAREVQEATLLDYMTRHACEPVTLLGVSRAVGMSPSSVQRVLVRKHGMRFHRTLDRLRLERALVALAKEPEVKIEALALTVGWRSRKNFYAAFRRTFGLSFSDLRQRAAKADLVNALRNEQQNRHQVERLPIAKALATDN